MLSLTIYYMLACQGWESILPLRADEWPQSLNTSDNGYALLSVM